MLPYESSASTQVSSELFRDNSKRISISGVQEKFSVLLDKNKLRLVNQGEQDQYILKPIPSVAKNPEYMPANEHLTMQLAKQVYNIETAQNAVIFLVMDHLPILPNVLILKKMVQDQHRNILLL